MEKLNEITDSNFEVTFNRASQEVALGWFALYCSDMVSCSQLNWGELLHQ